MGGLQLNDLLTHFYSFNVCGESIEVNIKKFID